ncbi:Hypothetical predicted protein [Prunus dulcis]|uniref:Uncharacterized protein n=1 Tax=Prunus dulcis TaxID=3755 RepID=A0A5E4G5M3_PRUDU|nr:Hypothetical predicted protein [Prunus dulcis]
MPKHKACMLQGDMPRHGGVKGKGMLKGTQSLCVARQCTRVPKEKGIAEGEAGRASISCMIGMGDVPRHGGAEGEWMLKGDVPGHGGAEGEACMLQGNVARHGGVEVKGDVEGINLACRKAMCLGTGVSKENGIAEGEAGRASISPA